MGTRGSAAAISVAGLILLFCLLSFLIAPQSERLFVLAGGLGLGATVIVGSDESFGSGAGFGFVIFC